MDYQNNCPLILCPETNQIIHRSLKLSLLHTDLYRRSPRLCQRQSWTRVLCHTWHSESSLYARTDERAESWFKLNNMQRTDKYNWNNGVYIAISYISAADNLLRCVHCFATSRTHIWAPCFLGKLWGVGVICRAMRSLSVKKNSFKEGCKVKSTEGELNKETFSLSRATKTDMWRYVSPLS